MQTFLPFENFEETAKCLDYRRLGKQRVEARQIYDLITRKTTNCWINHPAVLMWWNYPEALAIYHDVIILEWVNRGYKNNMPYLTESVWYNWKPYNRYNYSDVPFPKWLGNEAFHSAHRAALLFKNYNWYSQFGWEEKPVVNYLWPKR